MFKLVSRYARIRITQTVIEWYRRNQLYQSIMLLVGIIIMHYLGFNLAVRGLPFPYFDLRFFINLTLTFALYIVFIIIALRLVYALLSGLGLFALSFAPDFMLATRTKLHNAVPYGRELLTKFLLAMIFIFTLLISYTDMGFFEIALALLVLPLTMALWLFAVYRVARLFKPNPIADATAETITKDISAIQNWARNIVIYLQDVFATERDNLLSHQAHAIEDHLNQLETRINNRSQLGDDVVDLVNKIKIAVERLQWYRHAFLLSYPLERRLLFALPLVYALWIGYAHATQYLETRQQEVVTIEGETQTLIPLQNGFTSFVYFDPKTQAIVQIPATHIAEIRTLD